MPYLHYLRLFIRITRLTACSLCIFSCFFVHGQDLSRLSDFKGSAKNKIDSALDSLKSNRLNIHGGIQATSGFSILPGEKNVLDYSVNANLLITYKGVKMPFSYRLSNGRSITRFSGPSFRTPSFRVLGLSPSYKGYTIHLGDRNMDFSKYTYSNVRFSGIGIETPSKGVYIKAMTGKLRPVSLIDQLHSPTTGAEYHRKAFGGILGFKNERIDLSGIVFSAKDDLEGKIQPDSGKALPKENAILSYQFSYKATDHLVLKYEQSFAALTRNAFDPRVDILSHQTTYNMLGLFTKRTSSEYHQAMRASCTYIIDAFDIGMEYETIDKGYLSLGSPNYDHNFRDVKMNLNGQLTQTTNISSSFGLRNILEKETVDDKDMSFIFNTTFTYQPSDQLNMYTSFSNFKNALYSYYRTQAIAEADTLILNQTNNNVMLGADYTICPERPTIIAMVLSHQITNTIENDAVQDQRIENNIITLSISKLLDKHNVTMILGFVDSKASIFKNTNYLCSITHSLQLNDKTTFNESLTYNLLQFNDQLTNQLTVRQSIQYKLKDNLSIATDFTMACANKDSSFSIIKTQMNCGVNYTF